jgi:hypothetical protein
MRDILGHELACTALRYRSLMDGEGRQCYMSGLALLIQKYRPCICPAWVVLLWLILRRYQGLRLYGVVELYGGCG